MEKNLSFPQEPVSRVRVKLTWAQAEMVSSKGDQLQLIVAGDDESVQELRVEMENDTLLIAQPQLGYAKDIPRRRWLEICVRIPDAWQGDVDVDGVTGAVGAYSIKAQDFSISTVSGPINVRDLSGSMVWLHTVSGAIAAQRVEAKKVNIRSVSSDATLSDSTAQQTKLFTVSGELAVSLMPGSHSVDSQSISGSVCIEVEPGTAVKTAFHSLSGQFLLEDGLQNSEGGLTVTASSVSGDLAIRKRESK